MAYLEKKSQGLESKKQYFGIMAENWIYNFFVQDTSIKDTTKERYVAAWKQVIKPLHLYNLPLEEVSASAIQQAYNETDCSPSALEATHKLMNRFYKYLEREGFSRNITGSIVLPKRTQRKSGTGKNIVIWTNEEVTDIFNSFDKAQKGFRIPFLLILAYHTGCRISELLALKYEDFATEGLTINKQLVKNPILSRDEKTTYKYCIGSPKSTSSYRTVPLNKTVIAELKSHKKWHKIDMMKNGYRTEYVFTTNTGAFYDRHNITHMCNRYYDRINISHKGFHTYRHTFGTNLCKEGVTIQTASSLLGHADINITAKYYVNVSQEEKQRAVELLNKAIY